MPTRFAECPSCFGRLMPLSVCASCNSVLVRDGLVDVGPEIDCEDCDATNPTHFVCSACNSRFPYADIVKASGLTCPVCQSPVPLRAELCPACGAVLPTPVGIGGRRPRRILGEYREEDLQELARIAGVGRQRAEALCRAGFNALWKIVRASPADLARVKGFRGKVASQVKDALRDVTIIRKPRSREQVLSEESTCPLCGAVTSPFATRCYDCGARFDDEEIDEEFLAEVAHEEDRALLAYYDVRLMESAADAPLHYARGILLHAMGRPADALASFDRTLELDPENKKAVQAKARALTAVRGLSSASKLLRDTMEPREEPAEGPGPQVIVEVPDQPEQPKPKTEMPPPPDEETLEEERLLEELEQAITGEERPPPPPLHGEVTTELLDRKRFMLSFFLGIPGVSRRAAEAVAGFFQDLDQVLLVDPENLGRIRGVEPDEAQLILDAVVHYVRPTPPKPEEAPPAPAAPEPVTLGPSRPLLEGRGFVDAHGRVSGLLDPNGFLDAFVLAQGRPDRAAVAEGVAEAAPVARSTAAKWAVRIAVGAVALVASFTAALVVLAHMGIRFAALSGLWTSWPPDEWKVVLGLLAFVGTVVVWYRFVRRPTVESPRWVRALQRFFLLRDRPKGVRLAFHLAFVAFALLALFAAALVVLAYAGLRVAALSGLWTSWPPDEWKVVLGVAIFVWLFALWYRSTHKGEAGGVRRFFQFERLVPAQGTARLAVLLVLGVFGFLALLAAILVALAYAGIYVDAFRGLWTSWPPDEWKVVLGLLAFVVCSLAWVRSRRAKAVRKAAVPANPR